MSTETTGKPTEVWIKSSFCDNSSGNCPEVMFRSDGTVAVRDSRTPAIALAFTAAEWSDWVAGAKAGEFDA